MSGQIEYHYLGEIGDNGESAAHVAVESAITDRKLALVSGCEQESAGFVGESH